MLTSGAIKYASGYGNGNDILLKFGYKTPMALSFRLNNLCILWERGTKA